jgi:hypothetical protein
MEFVLTLINALKPYACAKYMSAVSLPLHISQMYQRQLQSKLRLIEAQD